jgi:peroxiredoxin family protein
LFAKLIKNCELQYLGTELLIKCECCELPQCFPKQIDEVTVMASATALQPHADDALLARISAMEEQLSNLQRQVPRDEVSIILLSSDFDKAMAAFMMANGAVGMGMEVSMFFTFWGCSVIKKGRKLKGKSFSHKLINLMLPADSHALAPSKMSFGGVGRRFFNHVMKGEMTPLDEQIEMAKELGICFQICAPSLSMMGFDDDEWVVPVEVCGVAAMYERALNARTAYFVS